jgi:hypothetical protein
MLLLNSRLSRFIPRSALRPSGRAGPADLRHPSPICILWVAGRNYCASPRGAMGPGSAESIASAASDGKPNTSKPPREPERDQVAGGPRKRE